MKANRDLETNTWRRPINAGALPLGDNNTKMEGHHSLPNMSG